MPKTWFKRTTADDFNSSNQLKMDSSTPTDPCNYVTLNTTDVYEFQLRWAGPWRLADKDLNLLLYGPYGPGQTATEIALSDDTQDGDLLDYPTEILEINSRFTPNITTAGRYCLLVTKKANQTAPAWVQLHSVHPSTTLSAPSAEGHIVNPAESANLGMLAVGASNNAATPSIKHSSSRGPAPEPHPAGRLKPDITGVNTDLGGTSYAAPRVAGIVTLAFDLLNNAVSPGTDPTPQTMVEALKASAKLAGQPNNIWGHGLARLGILGPLENVQIEHVPCATARVAKVTFDDTISPIVINSGNGPFHEVEMKPVGGGDAIKHPTGRITVSGDEQYFAFHSLPDGVRYEATTKTCIRDNQGNLLCSEVSEPSRPAFIPAETCTPATPTTIAGHDYVTFRWDHDRHATSYQIEVDGNVLPTRTKKNYVIVRNIDDAVFRFFRVKSFGPQGESDWSGSVAGTNRFGAGPADTTGEPTPEPQGEQIDPVHPVEQCLHRHLRSHDVGRNRTTVATTSIHGIGKEPTSTRIANATLRQRCKWTGRRIRQRRQP